jgi:DNA adenine methylase
VYLDPPYYVEDRRVFNEYGPHRFLRNDLDRLIDIVDYLNEIGAGFLMSYADDKYVEKKLRKWIVGVNSIDRTISGSPSGRVSQKELLISNIELFDEQKKYG